MVTRIRRSLDPGEEALNGSAAQCCDWRGVALVVLSELAVDALDRRPHGHGNGPGSSASPLMTFRAEIIA
jgi:hypothetical protein